MTAMSRTIKNADLHSAIGSLAAVGKTALPMPLALRMAKLRRNLEDHEKAVEETRAGIFERVANGKQEIKSTDPEFKEYSDAYGDLMDIEYALGDHFVLYTMTKDDETQFSWSPPKDGKFKTKLTDLEPNVLHGLLPLVEEVDVTGGGAAE